MIEGHDERDQIQRQRHDPQKRHGGNIDRNMVRGGQQHDRGERGQGDPQQAVDQGWVRCGATWGSRLNGGGRTAIVLYCNATVFTVISDS